MQNTTEMAFRSVGWAHSTDHYRTTCIKQGFWPPLKPKIESYFATFSSNCFIRLLAQVFIFHIVLTLMVAMVTENDCQYRLK